LTSTTNFTCRKITIFQHQLLQQKSLLAASTSLAIA
jgi:hypothetical protein